MRKNGFVMGLIAGGMISAAIAMIVANQTKPDLKEEFRRGLLETSKDLSQRATHVLKNIRRKSERLAKNFDTEF